MRRLLPPAIVALLAVTIAPADTNATSEDSGFTVVCGYDHSLTDDPIVYPGQPGASHLHDFFGSHVTDAYSTPETLVTSDGTSCFLPADRSGYWFPSLVVDGEPHPPTTAAFYYRGPDRGYPWSLVKPIPEGLVMVAGDPRATAKQPFPVTYWQCGPGYGIPKSPTPVDCTPYPGTTLRVKLTFPSCWDGENLDSFDHKGHMSYPDPEGASVCPADHPMLVAKLTAVVTYDVVDGSQAMLSSGSPYSFHGDFMNGWDQNRLALLVQTCIEGGASCK
jgi:hypothetical protein